MKLKLIRRVYNEHETIGELFIDGVFECYTLEDVVRPEGEKIYGETAIGYGQYNIEISWSPRFRRMLPLLLDVPNIKGIRIHPGNYHQDTEGCILVAKNKVGEDRIQGTQEKEIFNKAKNWIEEGFEVKWIIINK